MRNLLVLLLIGGIAFLGYEFGRRRNPDETNKPGVVKAAEKKTEKQVDVKSAGTGLEPLKLDTTGMVSQNTGAGAEVAIGSKEFEDDGVAASAKRYVAALLARDLDSVEAEAGLRESFPLGSTARYALEVALSATQGPDDASGDRSEQLGQAAQALLAGKPGQQVLDGLAAGFAILVGTKRLGRAVIATGGRNDFLAGKGGGAAYEQWIQHATELEPTKRTVALSSLLDVLTRGRVNVWGEGAFRLLSDGYRALQGVLRKTLFNRNGRWRSQIHKVGNETLGGIARRFGKEWDIPMSWGLLQRINGIPNPKALKRGQELRIPMDRARVVVEKSTFTMKVFLGDVLIRVYEVGLGEDDSTPETEFEVTELQLDPQWTNPKTGVTVPAHHPENLIGRFFIKLYNGRDTGFGIHGTKDQSSIGKNSSMGCIRLRQTDIEDLFSYLPRKTKVLIRR